ncbi:MAG: glycoside hydrolase N-terminal domain-containing protein [Clostridia bacterium]|nr:glycoside hydrolase N-terminal domain-containing protein [Clostridia bacterium]
MENKLHFSSPARYFEEALPLGNGTLGAMVYGGCDKERISLNHDTLWSGKPRHISRPGAQAAYKKAQSLALAGRAAEAEKLLERDFTADFGQSYLPAGSVFVETESGAGAAEYRRELDMENGTARVCFTAGGTHFEREYFVSHPDMCVCARFRSDKPASYTVFAESPLKSEARACGGEIYLTGECPVSIAPAYARDICPTVYSGEGIKFTAITAVNAADGEVRAENGSIKISGTTEFTLAVCIETSFVSFDAMPAGDSRAACEKRMTAAREKTYAELFAAHTEDFSRYYNRVKLELGFGTPALTTEERIKALDKSRDLGLVELIFNFGRYLIISSSREGSQAANLQGIWNEELFAPWSSNYTVNINAEMNYWPVLMCNLAGFDAPVIDLVKKISVTGARTAREYYGAKGYCAHHNIDLWGLSTPVGAQREGCVRYAFWNMSAGWLCRHVWEHYEYTLDRDYLEKTAYPLLRGAAEFYLSLLIEHEGKYIMCPATSPENSYYTADGTETALAKYSTMSQAIAMDLFENVSRAAGVLGIDDAFVREVREKLPLLGTYAVGAHGELLEYDGNYAEVDEKHRHTSHLYGLYPGESISAEKTPQLAEACRVTLLRRGDKSTGWSMGWRVNLWARLGEGERALELVKKQLTYVEPTEKRTWKGGGTYANLFDAHPPFQIDGNFGVCAGIAQMLLQSENGKIKILPALPRELARGSVSGLLAKGNITVGIAWETGKPTRVTLASPTAQDVTLTAQGREIKTHLEPGEKKEIAFV